jgi:1,4-dihydroxy-2-naphthoyl-CoA synthase
LVKELEYGIPVFLSEDAKEGPKAFKEKRESQFYGEIDFYYELPLV